MTINKINMANTNIMYRGKISRPIKEKGFYEGYFMEKSPLAKDYVPKESTFSKIINKLKKMFD